MNTNNYYAGTSSITILDKTSSRMIQRDITLDELFETYVFKISGNTISFDDSTVKVEDLFGWTDLLSIKKVTGNNTHDAIVHMEISSDKSLHVIAGCGSTLPTYDDTRIIKGYHGETKYPRSDFALSDESVVAPSNDMKLRYRDDDGDHFSPFSSTHTPSFDVVSRYEILTKSGYLNINRIHLYDNHIEI